MPDYRSRVERLTAMSGQVDTSNPRSFTTSPFSVTEVNNYPPGDPREPVHIRDRVMADPDAVEAVEAVEEDAGEAPSGAPEIHIAPDGSTTHGEPVVVPEAGAPADDQSESAPEGEGEPPVEVEPIQIPENVTALSRLTVDVLEVLAEQQGVKVEQPSTKAKLIAALRPLVEGEIKSEDASSPEDAAPAGDDTVETVTPSADSPADPLTEE